MAGCDSASPPEPLMCLQSALQAASAQLPGLCSAAYATCPNTAPWLALHAALCTALGKRAPVRAVTEARLKLVDAMCREVRTVRLHAIAPASITPGCVQFSVRVLARTIAAGYLPAEAACSVFARLETQAVQPACYTGLPPGMTDVQRQTWASASWAKAWLDFMDLVRFRCAASGHCMQLY